MLIEVPLSEITEIYRRLLPGVGLFCVVGEWGRGNKSHIMMLNYVLCLIDRQYYL